MVEVTHSSSIELLAPAGNWECARAAVENGADAIYFGLDIGFNARARAANFHVRELKQLMLMLHRQGVRGYVTLNTLVFTNELPTLESNVRQLAEAGVDAVLVQDLGVARLIRELCPEMVVHASTQMTLTNADAIERARELGVQRVVLARELSLSEIRQISSRTSMPLEAFVHGALCVAYSGQCLTSESFGGRSANRGQCAQACRLPYELYCDGEHRDLGDFKYLLSPQDLAAHDYVPQLLDAGITSLKIEGRLKTPEYVANVCSQYRLAIDAALQQKHRKLSDSQRRDLEMSFSRGFSPGWLEGCDHKRLVPGKSSAKRGVMIGRVVAAHGDRIQVELSAPVATGDGIVLEGDRFAGEEIGSRIFQIFQSGKRVDHAQQGLVELGLKHGSLTSKSFSPSNVEGLQIWKTDDPQLTKRLRKTFDGPDPIKRVSVAIHAIARIGQPLVLQFSTSDSPVLEVRSQHILELARKHPLDEETLRSQLGRLGGTVYQLGALSAELDGQAMVPLSVLGQLRRAVIEALDAARVTRPLPCSAEDVTRSMLERVAKQALPMRASALGNFLDESPGNPSGKSESESEPWTLRVLCRSLSQVEQVLSSGVKHVIAELHDLREYRQAVEKAHQHAASLEIATLRIHKPGEDGLFRALAKHGGDSWLVRNLAGLDYAQQHGIPFACDFSLNVTNPLTAEQLMRWGATRITASYDLNRDQLCELVAATPADWLEVVIHQHMPMFHMEHCVFCSVLSPGRNKSDCGRPCDRHDVQLEDRVGAKHVLHADIGCRNTLYNGVAQSGAEAVKPLQELGIRNFRVELLRDAADADVKRLVHLYRDLLSGRTTGAEVWKALKADNRIGVTRGTLEQARNPLAIL
ncbi:MAG: U32 family peptidase [bacterium]|nr:U32 family peptidase [bacterium]